MNLDLQNRSPLTPADRVLIERALRMLVGIQNPNYLALAQREGYTAAEHKLGWSYVQTAGGSEQPFVHHLAAERATSQSSEMHGERLAVFQQLDAFENSWFPRTRAIIRRVVSAEQRDAFEAAFFHGLEQQPLGPMVAQSVRTFVNRIEGLEDAKDVDSKRLRKVLAERGLTAARIASIQRLLASATEYTKVDTVRVPTQAELEAAATAQQAALESLRGWVSDWSATFRSIFSTRALVNLGIAKLKRRAGEDEDEVELEDADLDAPSAPVAPAQPVVPA